jgi:hypothetical protein
LMIFRVSPAGRLSKILDILKCLSQENMGRTFNVMVLALAPFFVLTLTVYRPAKSQTITKITFHGRCRECLVIRVLDIRQETRGISWHLSC